AKDILPEILYFFTKSALYWKQLKEKELGTAQPNVNATKLGQIEITFPENKDEQQKIVDKIKVLEEKISIIKKLQDEVKNWTLVLPKTVLSKAFSGELV
ncbi:MAG: restriction endonuclease subunit S, partial [archaeon]|nr:restriction endonuclease subunit S [archaeon]